MADVLESISHSSVIRYLDRRGWSKADELLNGVICIFEKDGHVLEVVTRPDLPSYKDRLRQAVMAIAISENREESRVAQDVVHSGSAKVSLRINPDLPQHYLKLEESKSLRNAMYDILIAVAHSAESRDIDITRLNRKTPKQILDGCVEEQTSGGSYTANFFIPEQADADGQGIEFAGLLGTALKAAHSLSKQEMLPSPSSYASLASEGVSWQFLDALGRLSSLAKDKPMVFALTDSSGSGAKLEFPKTSLEFLDEVADSVKQHPDTKDFTKVEATIQSISRNFDGTGIMKLVGVFPLEIKDAPVLASVSNSDLKIASDFFNQMIQSGKEVQVKLSGYLLKRKRARNFELTDVRDLALSDRLGQLPGNG